MRPMLTPSDVARRLAVSPRTVRRLVQRGELRGVRVGSLVRIPEDALDEWERAQGVSANDNAGTGTVPDGVARVIYGAAPLLPAGEYEPVFPGAVPWRSAR
jgi:excisionase family DNA binding protein